jgi:uncharacterized protein YjbJ (UPF0337 family)
VTPWDKEIRMTDSTADQARHGLAATIAGKAKEVVGAVTGNDSLAAEGQLQQAEAEAAREASTKQAVAEAETKEAAERLAAEQRVAQAEKQAAASVAGAREEAAVERADREATEAEIRAE